MKNIYKTLLVLLISKSASAAIISYHIEGSITGTNGVASSNPALLSQYATNYGVQTGTPVTFDISIDTSRPGQINNPDGTTTILNSYSDSSTYSSYWFYYSNLERSSINFSAFSTGASSNNYAETSEVGRIAPLTYNSINLGESLVLWAPSQYCCGFSATNWEIGQAVSFHFDISDANGVTTYNGQATVTPLPASFALFGTTLSSLFLAGIRHRKITAAKRS